MQNGIVVNQSDIKTILAKYFEVPESNIISSKYSYVVVGSTKKIDDIQPEKGAVTEEE